MSPRITAQRLLAIAAVSMTLLSGCSSPVQPGPAGGVNLPDGTGTGGTNQQPQDPPKEPQDPPKEPQQPKPEPQKPQAPVVTKCSLNEINTDGTCAGPQQPGIESLGVYVRDAQIPTFTGQPGTEKIDGYLTAVLTDVNQFWTDMYVRGGIKSEDNTPYTSYVKYNWLLEGQVAQSGCSGKPTNIKSMFYCSVDDTIYLSIPAMLADWLGQPLPGENSHLATGEGSAIYTIAHEYAHNVQQELGINPQMDVHAKELEADCLAGVYLRGGINLDSGTNRQNFQDVIANADFSGDYGFDNAQHHGTPDERMIAVLTGHNTANPAVCVKNYE